MTRIMQKAAAASLAVQKILFTTAAPALMSSRPQQIDQYPNGHDSYPKHERLKNIHPNKTRMAANLQTTPSAHPQFLRVTEVAKLLKLKPRTIYDMVAQERIPYRKPPD